MDNEPFNSPYLTYRREGPFMLITYKKDLVIDIDTARKIVTERLSVYNGNEYPTLVDIRQAKLFTKEARDYFAGDGVKGMKALALVTGGYLTVITANLFIRFSKPIVPTKVFKTREQAMKWLSQYA